ncbi:hypothetical protein Z517_04269 [Fonsecaea pedrosoi CBS 271.37]|uniref:Uncharacterized protein n=1 Tax=Fonsecaea pedrosoi CBS 271.37 TaxID=1442368 RepID=A0A0D2H9H5_9EURO|nr:uncharacterized protein Z517_04269 [Fonsecaea pedrosoi CBS 271.37]KIW81244.1 hypothetical protein Z517_04269 [Fonsecaea pedrosoi CBS 271.37]
MNPLTCLLSLISLCLILVQPVLGAKSTATSFCKCICFNNSTIIALNPPPSSTSASAAHNLAIRSPHALAVETSADSSDDSEGGDGPAAPSRPHRKLTCADCTRAFCLDYNLPICKDAREEDVFTTCFQRDSLKDETVVVIFVFATAGLLAWAVVKPWIDRVRERNTFVPLLQHDRGTGGSRHYTSTSPRGQRNSRGTPRAGGLGVGTRGGEPGEEDDDLVGGSGHGNSNGKGPQRGGGRDVGQSSTAHAHTPYDDEDMHADQDAMDIVSSMPSGSGTGSRP